MAIVIAYDIYLECSEGKLDPTWKLVDPQGKPNPVSFHVFRETLARQMLAYNPANKKYLGDELFRATTVQTKAKRARSPVPPPQEGVIVSTEAGITEDALNLTSTKLRLCGFLGDVTEHFDSCQTMDDCKKLTCVYCGKLSYQFCNLCGVAVHKFTQEDGQPACFFRYHDTGCFGLARSDFKITNKKQKEWSYPTLSEIRKNEEQMKKLSAQQLRTSSSTELEENDSDDDDE
ncbi:MAG: hypothetical protein ACRCZI_09890 [Cetobacterium sp.]